MRWLACAWLVVVGCFDPPPFPASTYDVTLLTASPDTVPVHGNEQVTITYKGELPSAYEVLLDRLPTNPFNFDPMTRQFTFQAPPHVEGPVRLSLRDLDNGQELAANTDLLSYYAMPATPLFETAEFVEGNLDWALHPELAESCARRASLYLTNIGDKPLTLTNVTSSDLAFTIGLPPEGCQGLDYYENCNLTLCFTSAIVGPHLTTLTAKTSAGDALLATEAMVLGPQFGLDASFDGGGVRIIPNQPWYDGRGIARPDGNGLAIWTHSQAISVGASSLWATHDVFTTINGFNVDWLRGMRAGAPGGGIYALVGDANGGSISAILHFTDDVTPDTSFAEIDLPIDGTLGYYRGLELAPGGRLLAIGSGGVLALVNGVVDTTYGTAGKTTFPPAQFRGESVIDSQGRLYVVLDDRVLRLTANGAIDSTFTYTGTPKVIAIASNDFVYIGTPDRVARLTDTGTELLLGSFPTDDIAIDGADQIFIVTGGFVRRYNFGSFSGTLGYGTARSVVCPPTGTCYILGTNNDTTAYPLAYYYENYVLRLGS